MQRILSTPPPPIHHKKQLSEKVPLIKRIFDEDLPYMKHKKLYRVDAALENVFLSHEMQRVPPFKDSEIARERPIALLL